MSYCAGDVVAERFLLESRRWPRDAYMGREITTGRPVLVSYAPRCALSVDELRTRLAYSVPGVSEVLYLDRIDRPGKEDLESPAVILVEEAPDGAPLSAHRLPLTLPVSLHIARRCCAIAAE